MEQNEFIAGIGKAASCHAVKTHQPRPLRFVWHHILPKACGGKTTTDNLIQVCDNCHYAIHALLYALATGSGLPPRVSLGQAAVARQGYEAAVTAGTVALIPKESTPQEAK